jgi:hypothetical protein
MRMNMPKEEYRSLASMSDEEIRIAEMLHEEGKAIAGVVTIAGAFVFFVVHGLGYL